MPIRGTKPNIEASLIVNSQHGRARPLAQQHYMQCSGVSLEGSNPDTDIRSIHQLGIGNHCNGPQWQLIREQVTMHRPTMGKATHDPRVLSGKRPRADLQEAQ